MKLKIGEIEYSVEKVNCTYANHNMGQCHTKRGKIFISDDLKDDIRHETIIHEALHAICSQYAIATDYDQEERIVNCMACGIHALIKDNPDFIREVIDGDQKD